MAVLDENPYVGVVTTLRDDGTPHSTVGKDEYPWRKPEEKRLKVVIDPEHVDDTGLQG